MQLLLLWCLTSCFTDTLIEPTHIEMLGGFSKSASVPLFLVSINGIFHPAAPEGSPRLMPTALSPHLSQPVFPVQEDLDNR